MTACGVSALLAQPQEPAKNTDRKTVWDGVYTDAQAASGQTHYEARCSRCHRDGPHRGDAFMREWSGTAVDGLFNLIKASMPADAPSSLSDDAYLDIVAYMLQVNTFPAGRNELNADMIKSIRIEGRNGPEPVPNFALVGVVGCLAQGPDAVWMLADASEPVRTRNPAASQDDELKDSQATSLGTQTFQLLNVYPRPDAYKGHRVEAKGFLIRDPAVNRINVTSVQTLAPRCD
jgi:cytochrome c5